MYFVPYLFPKYSLLWGKYDMLPCAFSKKKAGKGFFANSTFSCVIWQINIFHGNEKDCAPFSTRFLELVQKEKNRQINYSMEELSSIRIALHNSKIKINALLCIRNFWCPWSSYVNNMHIFINYREFTYDVRSHAFIWASGGGVSRACCYVLGGAAFDYLFHR